MPDIFKKLEFVETDDSVNIPDMTPFPSLGQEVMPCQEEWTEEAGGQEGENGVEPSHQQVHVLTRMELEELYAEELSQIRQDAAEQAYYDAITQRRGEFKECIAQVQLLLDELQNRQNEFIRQFSAELKELAIEIAEKIMLLRIAEDDMSLSALVLQSIATMKRSKWLSVELSERLVNLVDFLNEEVKKVEYHGRAEISPIACPDDTVRVNTEDGTVVATISVQTQHLREAFANADTEK